MEKQPLLLRVMQFSPDELEMLLTCAVKLMHVDNRLRLEEESIINLVPELLHVAKDDAPEELKSEWRKKLIMASYAIRKNPENFINDCSAFIGIISDNEKRATCLAVLFLIMSCDRHIDKREIEFVVNNLAIPWNFTIDELIGLLEDDAERLFVPEMIIKHLRELKNG